MKEKKKLLVFVLPLVIILAVLFVPIYKGTYDDGGTREYVALTYKIIDWKKIQADGVYEKTRVYFGNDRNKTVDELWKLEHGETEIVFIATVVELSGDCVLVEPLEGEVERASSDRISFSRKNLEEIDVKTGSVVQISYDGQIMESYPAQINAKSWCLYTE